MPKQPDVDSYIADADADARPILRELRELVRSTLPGVDEGISWGVPFYKHHGAFGGFAAYKKHVSFGTAAELQSEDRAMLEELGYRTGKKTVQIGFDQDVPAAAIQRILRAQARANDAKGGRPREGA